jgi:hypothetical protein
MARDAVPQIDPHQWQLRKRSPAVQLATQRTRGIQSSGCERNADLLLLLRYTDAAHVTDVRGQCWREVDTHGVEWLGRIFIGRFFGVLIDRLNHFVC